MKKNKNSIPLSNYMNDLTNARNILKEAFGDMEMGEQVPHGQMADEQVSQEGENEMEPVEDPQMNDIISQIRELAIKGIAQFADQVESEKYQSLKRIWLETDKFYESMFGDKKK
jgi:hypothetical protein